MRLFLIINTKEYSIQIEDNESYSIQDLWTTIQHFCDKNSLLPPYTIQHKSQGRYLTADDFTKLAATVGIIENTTLIVNSKPKTHIPTIRSNQNLFIPSRADTPLLSADIVCDTLTGYLENEYQVENVWHFFHVKTSAELMKKHYYEPGIQRLKEQHDQACGNPGELLNKAINDDDVWLLRLAIEQGADINFRSEISGLSRLDCAIEFRSIKCLNQLLNQTGIQPNNSDIGESALMLAIRLLYVECIDILLRSVDLAYVNSNGQTALSATRLKLEAIANQHENINTTATYKNNTGLIEVIDTREYLTELMKLLLPDQENETTLNNTTVALSF